MTEPYAQVSIRILDKEYQVACPASERTDLLDSAEILNAKMREVRDNSGVVGLDRIAVMAKELAKMGAEIGELLEGLVIRQSELKPAHLHGHGDHRVVMALSLAGMALDGQTVIDTAEAVNVTFPDYVKLMRSIGGNIEITG